MQQSQKIMKTVALACGGTGGHLAPGIALAERLQEQQIDCLLIVSEKSIDQQFIQKYGFSVDEEEKLSETVIKLEYEIMFLEDGAFELEKQLEKVKNNTMNKLTQQQLQCKNRTYSDTAKDYTRLDHEYQEKYISFSR